MVFVIKPNLNRCKLRCQNLREPLTDKLRNILFNIHVTNTLIQLVMLTQFSTELPAIQQPSITMSVLIFFTSLPVESADCLDVMKIRRRRP